MYGFSNQFSIAWENSAKAIKLVPILSQKYGYFFPPDFHPMVSPTSWKMHGFSHQFSIASIPDTLGVKEKYIKRKRGHECHFIKKEECKYTLCKSIPPYKKLFLLLAISFKNYNSYSKMSTKAQQPGNSAGKCPRVIFLKKIVNSIYTFLLPCDVVVVLLQKLLSFIRLYCYMSYIEFIGILILNCYYYR